MTFSLHRFLSVGFTLAAVLVLQGCDSANQTAAPMQAPPPPSVGVITATPQTVQLSKNLPARLEASRTAVIQARVTGIVKKRLFKEGAYVQSGEVLFQIDDTSFRANLASAKAQLAQAKATEKLNLADVNRYKQLFKDGVISQQSYQQAQTNLATTRANIEIAKAAITQAELNVQYARVSAPISGFIGQAEVTEGALVSAATGTQMAKIQQVDPLYVNIKQPATEVLKIKQMLLNNQQKKAELEKSGVAINVTLQDGTPYPHQGKLLFADVNVDAATGEAFLRATLPNPNKLLMPGLYVRAQVPQIQIDNAYLIPQQAITRGNVDTLLVVNSDNSFAPKVVTIAQSKGNQWVVTKGLQANDKVIVDGVMHLRGAKTVNPVPWQGLGTAKSAPAH